MERTAVLLADRVAGPNVGLTQTGIPHPRQ
jgi:hypothetical protein